MTSRLIPIVGIVLWALLASQHFFYAVGLGAAQRALGGPAYVELRNAIDDVMRGSLPIVYGATLLWTILLVWRGGPGRIAYTVALVALFADVAVMALGNMPINALMHTWTPDALPADWQTHRAAWLDAFRWRQIAAGIGFVSVVVGAVR